MKVGMDGVVLAMEVVWVGGCRRDVESTSRRCRRGSGCKLIDDEVFVATLGREIDELKAGRREGGCVCICKRR